MTNLERDLHNMILFLNKKNPEMGESIYSDTVDALVNLNAYYYEKEHIKYCILYRNANSSIPMWNTCPKMLWTKTCNLRKWITQWV